MIIEFTQFCFVPATFCLFGGHTPVMIRCWVSHIWLRVQELCLKVHPPGTMQDSGDWTWDCCMQGKHPTVCTNILVLYCYFYLTFSKFPSILLNTLVFCDFIYLEVMSMVIFKITLFLSNSFILPLHNLYLSKLNENFIIVFKINFLLRL